MGGHCCLKNVLIIHRFDVKGMPLIKHISRGILRGLRWMHKHHILHRDVKRENIFYDQKSKRVVLADLGKILIANLRSLLSSSRLAGQVSP